MRTWRWCFAYMASSFARTTRNQRSNCVLSTGNDPRDSRVKSVRIWRHHTALGGKKKPPHTKLFSVWRCLGWWSWRDAKNGVTLAPQLNQINGLRCVFGSTVCNSAMRLENVAPRKRSPEWHCEASCISWKRKTR